MSQAGIAIVGGGAAGLATAIFAARGGAGSIVILDGAKKLGAKILVSGGGRCNVTNTQVGPADFWGGSRNAIRRVLAALPATQTVGFFQEIGVTLHEEPGGKLFPDTNSARTVLDALLREAGRLSIRVLSEHRVHAVQRDANGFNIATSRGDIAARQVVLATGGQSLPKTGSDGAGYQFARSLGHSLVPTTPGLAPLVLAGTFHAPLSGISQDVELVTQVDGSKPVRLAGSMLWTHFGVSGPAALDASRHWHRAKLEGRTSHVTVSFLPGGGFEQADARFTTLAASQPKTALHKALASVVPARVADAMLDALKIERRIPLAHLSRELRRRLVHALLNWPLEVRDSRGYNYAEVTAGGVPLDEIDPASMESRRCPGLYLVGEILDVDGRIGGFNFQWAWASGFAAARGLTQR